MAYNFEQNQQNPYMQQQAYRYTPQQHHAVPEYAYHQQPGSQIHTPQPPPPPSAVVNQQQPLHNYAPQQQSSPPDENQSGSVYQVALQRYGNPLAHNPEWAPTRQDYQALVLPTIDLTMRIKARFNGRSSDKVFDPPPPSFLRPTPPTFQPRPFPPWSSKSAGKGEIAGEGFKSNYLGNIMVPHDVSAADWFRFLEDIVVSSKLSGGQNILANVAPITMHMGATGYFVTRAITKGMMKRKEPVVLETIETWQQQFFTPRGLDVFVREGKERLTARSPGGDVPQNMMLMAEADQHFSEATDADDFVKKNKHDKRKKDRKDKKEKHGKITLTVASLMR